MHLNRPGQGRLPASYLFGLYALTRVCSGAVLVSVRVLFWCLVCCLPFRTFCVQLGFTPLTQIQRARWSRPINM